MAMFPLTVSSGSGWHRPGNEGRSSISFAQNLALLSLMLKGNHNAAADQLLRGAVRPDDFARFTSQHRLQLFVFSLLEGSPLRKSLPEPWREQLRVFSLRQWATQERLARELTHLSALLAAAGQEFILLKGPYLATRFFGGVDRREFWDLDILVKREQVAAVERLLRSVGYARKSTILLNKALTTRFTHAFDFAKSDVAVDLHWILSANAAHYLDYEAVWRERQSFVLRNHTFGVLSDEYEVAFSLISIFKDLERGASRLKSFVDLYFILSPVSRRLDWGLFLAHRRREKILRISVNVLDLFFELFDCRREFPEVAAALAGERRHVKILPSGYHQALIDGSPGALKNKTWAAGIYECSRLHVFVWWLLSLPFRLAVHDSGRYARFKARLQQAKARLSRAKSAQDSRPIR
jgi:hypothetical protein